MLNEPIRNQLGTITKLYMKRLDETRQKILFVTNHQTEIDANVNVKTEMKETVIKKKCCCPSANVPLIIPNVASLVMCAKRKIPIVT